MAFTSGSLTGGQLEIGIALVLQDRFSNQAREASSQIRGLHRDAKNAVMANVTALSTMGNLIGDISSTIGGAISAAIDTGAQFIDTMVSVGAIANATGKDLSDLSDIAASLGQRTMFMPEDIASGMKFLAMAGNDAKAIKDMIGSAALMANAVGMELGGKGGAADLLTNIMRTFKMEGQEAASKLADQLTKATVSANISMTDLADSIRYAGATMTSLNISLPQTAAMIGTLGNAGIQASIAGTSIRNMAQDLVKSATGSKKAGAAALAALGLRREDLVDAKGDLKDFAEILSKIQAGFDRLELPSDIKTQKIFEIFGARGMRAAVALMNDTEGYLNLLRKIQNESAGTANTIAEKRMATLPGQINQLGSAIKSLFVAFTQALDNPVVKGFLSMIKTGVNMISKLFQTPLLGPLMATIAAVIPVVGILSSRFIALRTRILMMTGDTQVSFKSMFALLTMGWRQSSAQALNYLGILQMIKAQRALGPFNTFDDVLRTAGVPAYVYGRMPAKLDKRGRAMAYTGKGATGWTYVPKDQVTKLDPMNTPRVLMGGVVGPNMGKNAPVPAKPKVPMSIRSNPQALQRLKVLRGLGKIGGGLLGLLGGPIGASLFAITTFGPMIYSALTKNKESRDENTSATNELSSSIRAQLASKDAEETNRLMTVEEMRYLRASLVDLSRKMDKIDPSKLADYTVQINVDGEVAMRKHLDKYTTNLRTELGLN